MRRTKAFWRRLTRWERIELVSIERGNSGSGYGGGGYLPDDCSECDGCGQPQLGCGLCINCLNRLDKLIAKGEGRKP